MPYDFRQATKFCPGYHATRRIWQARRSPPHLAGWSEEHSLTVLPHGVHPNMAAKHIRCSLIYPLRNRVKEESATCNTMSQAWSTCSSPIRPTQFADTAGRLVKHRRQPRPSAQRGWDMDYMDAITILQSPLYIPSLDHALVQAGSQDR